MESPQIPSNKPSLSPLRQSVKFSRLQIALLASVLVIFGTVVIFLTRASDVGPNSTTISVCPKVAFPSRLKAADRKLVREDGCPMPKLRGFNIHAGDFVWNDADFADIRAKGGRILRTVINWQAIEPSQSQPLNQVYLDNLDKHIARAQKNGLYVIVELHLNICKIPAWATDGYTCGSTAWSTSGRDETEQYAKYGQRVTQTLAQRYSTARTTTDGMAINPKTVVGFGLNEPPQDSTTINGNSSIPTFEAQQRQMISWFRQGGAPDWIGFVTLGYANQKPQLASPRTSANPDAYDYIGPGIPGGNVVFDAHDYFVYNSNESPTTDSRQGNGVVADTRHFNPGAHWLALADPHIYPPSVTHESQMVNYLKPFDMYATAAGIPLMIGEFGWENASGFSGKTDYYKAKKTAFNSINTAIEIHWIYASSYTQDKWSAKSSPGVWDPDVLAWLQGT